MNRPTNTLWFGLAGRVVLIAALPACLGWLASDPTQARQAGKQGIRRGVSKQTAAALRKAAKSNDQAGRAEAAKAGAAINAGLDAGLKKERDAIAARLKARPEFQTLEKELNAIRAGGQGKKLTPQEIRERNQATARIFNKHKQMLVKAFQEAKADDDRITAAVREQLGGSLSLRKGTLGTFAGGLTAVKLTPTPFGSFVLKNPYDDTATEETKDLVVNINSAVANKGTGAVSVNGDVEAAGGGSNSALVEDFLTVPAGFSQLQLTMKIRETHELFAAAFLSFARCSADIQMDLTGGPNNQTQKQTTNISLVVAPVFFFIDDKGSADHVVTATFTVPRSGGEFLVRAGVRSEFAAGGAARAYTDVSATVSEIDVKALP
jgi:hypothetical protein